MPRIPKVRIAQPGATVDTADLRKEHDPLFNPREDPMEALDAQLLRHEAEAARLRVLVHGADVWQRIMARLDTIEDQQAQILRKLDALDEADPPGR